MAKKFIDGKGWEIDDSGSRSSAAAQEQKPSAKAQAKKNEGADKEYLEKVAASLGLVLISAADLKANVERIGELERQLDYANNKLAELTDGNHDVEPAADGKALTKAELEDAIAKAQTLEALTSLMKDVEDKTLLKLADAKADELKGSN